MSRARITLTVARHDSRYDVGPAHVGSRPGAPCRQNDRPGPSGEPTEPRPMVSPRRKSGDALMTTRGVGLASTGRLAVAVVRARSGFTWATHETNAPWFAAPAGVVMCPAADTGAP